ncbi:MAG: SusE domain-containing protein [Saonia sp.]
MKYLGKFLSLILMFSLVGCTDDDPTIVASAITPPVLSSQLNGSTVVLTEETASNIALTFTWSPANFDVSTVESYELFMGISGNDFAEPHSFGTTTNTFVSLTVQELNNLLLDTFLQAVVKDGDDNTIPVAMEAKVVASLGSSQAMESDVISFSIVPFEESTVPIILKNLFLVGNATAFDWNNNNNNSPIIRDPNNANLFGYKGRFLGIPNEFKLLEIRGQWQPQWGLDSDSFVSSDALGRDPSNISIGGPEGYYEILINIEEGTLSISPYDASGATIYSTIGIMGSARTGNGDGWDDTILPDTDLVQSAFDPHIWYIEELELFSGEIKFRAENAWDTSWGNDTPLTGYGSTENGPNIPVDAGTYEIWFNDLDGSYILVEKE